MKKNPNKILVIVICVFVILSLFALISKENDWFDVYRRNIEDDVTITIQYEGVVDEKVEYDYAISKLESSSSVPKNTRKMIKLSVTIDNQSDYSICGVLSTIENDELFISDEGLEYNLSQVIASESTEITKLYALTNEDLTETEIINALIKEEFEFVYNVVDEHNQISPRELKAKGEFIDGKAEPNPWTTPPYTG